MKNEKVVSITLYTKFEKTNAGIYCALDWRL